MRKFTALLLALVMVLAMSACSGNKNVKLKILDTEYAEDHYAIAISKENTELLGKINTALAELTEEGTTQKIIDKYISGKDHDLEFQTDAEGKEELKMATNATFPPYEFYENDKIVGIDAEMGAAIADKLGMKLVIVDTEFGSIIGGVTTGKYDMGMAGMTITEDRKEKVNFSDSYATGVQVIIVAENSPITSADDMLNPDNKYTVGVQQDTVADIYLSDTYENGGVTEANVKKYKAGTEAVQALLAGKVDCVVIDQEPAKAYVESNNK